MRYMVKLSNWFQTVNYFKLQVHELTQLKFLKFHTLSVLRTLPIAATMLHYA